MREDAETNVIAKEAVEKIKAQASRDYQYKFDQLEQKLNHAIENKLASERQVDKLMGEFRGKNRLYSDKYSELHSKIAKISIENEKLKESAVLFGHVQEKLKSRIQKKKAQE